MEEMIRIKYKSKKLEYDSKVYGTLNALQNRIREDTKVSVENQKIIVHGKVVKSEEMFGLLIGGKAVLIGSTDEEIEKSRQKYEEAEKMKVRIKDDSKGNPHLDATIAAATSQKKPRKRGLPEYRFQEIKVLKQFADSEVARGILEELAEDPGFQFVLKKHKWKVGTLSEMMPEGFVGISEVCVLGVNKNMGQEISLRIRTDDFRGFRKMTSIREVLCHELAHMEHSDHDGKFYTLMRQIQREIVEGNWKLSHGRVLGVSKGRRPVGPFSPPSKESPKDSQTKPEVDNPKGLSEAHNDETNQSSLGTSEKRIDEPKLIQSPPKESKADNTQEEDAPATRSEQKEVESEEVSNTITEKGEREINVDLESLPEVPQDIKEQLTKSMELLLSRNEEPVALAALKIMLKLARNILRQPDEAKFRMVRMSNKAFHAKVLKPLSGRVVMTSMGWLVNEEEDTMVLLNTPENLALLFFSMTELEKWIKVWEGIVVS